MLIKCVILLKTNMQVIRSTLILIVAIACLEIGQCLRCLHCDNIYQPRHCRTVTTCSDDEICGSKRVTTNQGNHLYNVGCFPKTVCNVKAKVEFSDMVFTSACTTKSNCLPRNSIGSVIVGKRSVHIDTRTQRHNICDTCCESDVCNLDCDTALADLNECHFNPCNHGTCEDSVGSFSCHCDAGYTGPTCDTAVAQTCTSNPCVHGTCHSQGETFYCLCAAGYYGRLCNTDIDDCASSPCGNSTCIDEVDSYTCVCAPGLTGSQCQTVIDHCSSSPCGNDACINMVDTFTCKHACGPGLTGRQCQTKLSDCVDVLANGGTTSGVYDIIINDTSEVLNVYCDMDTDGGGWTVFQNRFNGSVDFYRHFGEYNYGFGDVNGEFWLGLHYIYELSKNSTELRIDLESARGNTAYETFKDFYLSPPSRYTLHVGSSHGTAGDDGGMTYNNGNAFSTFDYDQDGISVQNCGSDTRGGWWFRYCRSGTLNGHYYTPGADHGLTGVIYRSFMSNLSLKSTNMMLRRDI